MGLGVGLGLEWVRVRMGENGLGLGLEWVRVRVRVGVRMG